MAQKHERWGFTLNAGVIEATDAGVADAPTRTSTQIADAGDSINTAYKSSGSLVRNSTTGNVFVATGANATSAWDCVTDHTVASVTPA